MPIFMYGFFRGKNPVTFTNRQFGPLRGGLIQVAGVRSLPEAEMLVRAGATHAGVPLGPGVREQDVSLAEAAALSRRLQGELELVCITYLTDPGEVLELCRAAGMRAVQLHAEVEVERLAALRRLAPELFIIKSLVVGSPGAEADVAAAARRLAPHVDALLTDTYDPATGARGATGKAHDWALSRAVVEASPVPVILAGGLGPDNVARALRATGAAGVDAHTRLENAVGDKDEQLVRRFVAEARSVLGART